MSTITERVERGAALLDEHKPGWWRLIDLGRLDIDSPCNCVCGQLGPYGATVRHMGLDLDGEISHGFEAGGENGTIAAECAALAAAWRDLITRCREQEPVST